MNIQITHANTADAVLVFEIMRAAFASYPSDIFPCLAAHDETLADVIAALESGGGVLAWAEGQAMGSARFRLHAGTFLIERVSVLPAFRGCGVATAMMAALEARALALGYGRAELTTRQSLQQNVRLYHHLGYTPFHIDELTGKIQMQKLLVLDPIAV